MGGSNSKRKQRPLPGEAEPETWPYGIRPLRTVDEICIIVEDLSEKRKLKRAGELQDRVNEIQDMIELWAEMEIEKLQGVQVTKMATAVEIFETELKRVYNKLINHQQKRPLVVSGLRLTGSLTRALEKVKHDLTIFEVSMQSILRDAEAQQTRPLALEAIGTQYSDEDATASGQDEFEPEDSSVSDGSSGGSGGIEPESENDEEGAVNPLAGMEIINSSSSGQEDEEHNDGSSDYSMSKTDRRSTDRQKKRTDSRRVSARSSRRRSKAASGSRSNHSKQSRTVAEDDDADIKEEPSMDDKRKEEAIERQEPGLEVDDQELRHANTSQLSTPAFGKGRTDRQERYSPDAAVDSSIDSLLDSPTAEFPLNLKFDRTSRWAGSTSRKPIGTQRGSSGSISPVQRELRNLISKADAGDPESALQAGLLCREGQLIEYDARAALEYFRLAAEAGMGEACFLVGSMVAVGEGLAAPDFEEAAAWYRRAACQGHIEAAASFGQALEGGIGVRENLGAAAAWYRKAALGGSGRGANSLGKLYFDGRGVPQDLEKAAAWFRYGAQCPEPLCAAAFNNLGICYEDGLGVECELEVARECYQRAADLGHLGALLNLAYLEFGRGDFSSARRHFESAASKGNADALYSLACILERQALSAEASVPSHVEQEQDVRKQGGHGLWGSSATAASAAATTAAENAELLFYKAAQAGDPRAQHRLASFYWDEGLVDEALSLFHNAAAQHHAPSLNALGIIAEEGQGGCIKDLQAAWECYRLAAHYGSVEAEKNLRAVDEVLESSELGPERLSAYGMSPATPLCDLPQKKGSSAGYSLPLPDMFPEKPPGKSLAHVGEEPGTTSIGEPSASSSLIRSTLPSRKAPSSLPPLLDSRHSNGPRGSLPLAAVSSSFKSYTIPVRIDYSGLKK